jgi:predicted metal-dependent hydrolase
MIFPQEYIDYLVHFHGNRDYFECHEILEDYWKKVDNRNKESIWVGFIQLAVANYHHRRSNFNGASRTIQKSLQIFSINKEELSRLGIEFTLLVKQMNEQLIRIENNQDYQSIILPIYSESLVEQCQSRSRELNMKWCSESDTKDFQIVHRHVNRDRTGVIDERKKALERKTNRRQ